MGKIKTNIKFNDLLKSVAKDEFEQYYNTHSKVDTMEHFNIGSTVWYKFISYYNIKKSKTSINKLREDTNLKKYRCKNQFQRVDYIVESYIKANGTLEAHYHKSNESYKNTVIKKYGVDHTSKLDSVKEKRKATVDSIPDFYSNRSKKTFTTKLERYGDGNYNNLDKAKQTNLERYGVECNFASKDRRLNGRDTQLEHWGHDNFNNRIKAMNTCKERYGEDYYINQVKLMMDSLSNSSCSKPNKEFAAYLLGHGIPFVKEYTINNYIYDFKLGQYLVEIDPWATHSSNFAPAAWEPKSELYHRNKTINALDNGFTCVHIFDWVNIDAIIYGILSKSLYLVDTNKPVKHIYDTKLKQLTNRENENTVIIYDDGFEVIY